MLYFTTGMKFFKTDFTDIKITRFTLITCFLPWLFAIFICFISAHVFRFGYILIGTFLPLKRKTWMSAGQRCVDNTFVASGFALVSSYGWTISCIKRCQKYLCLRLLLAKLGWNFIYKMHAMITEISRKRKKTFFHHSFDVLVNEYVEISWSYWSTSPI